MSNSSDKTLLNNVEMGENGIATPLAEEETSSAKTILIEKEEIVEPDIKKMTGISIGKSISTEGEFKHISAILLEKREAGLNTVVFL